MVGCFVQDGPVKRRGRNGDPIAVGEEDLAAGSVSAAARLPPFQVPHAGRVLQQSHPSAAGTLQHSDGSLPARPLQRR